MSQSKSVLDQVPSHARPNVDRVKNKSAAPVQVTAEQLLREAWEQKETAPAKLPKLQIADREELQDYQRNERKTFEMRIVRNRSHFPIWQRYARWEEEQSEFTRARSIWERAIDNDFSNPVVWLNYAEMEMRHRFINHARNVLDRAVALLPRADALWLKYAHMEEMLGKVDLARLVFTRWLKWFPENTAYFAFIRFELRHNNVDNARNVYAELLAVHPTAQSYIKAAKFEERHQHHGRARDIFERATDELPPMQQTGALFIAFAKFEQRRKQHARARAIYKFALEKLGLGAAGVQGQQQQEQQKRGSSDDVEEVERAYAAFEKLHGDRDGLESLLHAKKVQALETLLKADPMDYESWFELMQLEENHDASPTRMRDVFERALTHVPAVASKPAWRRYIQLWLAYAAWTELSMNDIDGAISIYKRCVACVPDKHRRFTFGKVWIAYAHAEVRRGDIAAARAVFGAALGVAPCKRKVYAAYVAMETAVGEMDRAREIFTVWVARDPTNGVAFAAFADLEWQLGETARARGVLETAVTVVSELNEAEVVWQRLADVVAGEGGDDALAAQRFETYVDRHESAMAWLAFVRMLRETGATGERVRATFRRATTRLRERARGAEEGEGETEEGGGMRTEEGERARKDAVRVGEAWVQWEREQLKEEGNGSEGEALVHAAREASARRVRGADGEWGIRFGDEVERTAGASGGVSASLLAAARRWKSKG